MRLAPWFARASLCVWACAGQARATDLSSDAIQLDILDCAQVSGARVREIVALEVAPRRVLAVGSAEPAATRAALTCPAGVVQIDVADATRATPLHLEIALRDLDPPARARLVALAVAELITTSSLQRSKHANTAGRNASARSGAVGAPTSLDARAPVTSAAGASRNAGASAKSGVGAESSGGNTAPARGASGVAARGASGVAARGASGVAARGASGVAARGASGVAVDGASGVAARGASGVAARGASGVAVDGASGVAVGGASGVAVDGASGVAVDGASGVAAGGASGVAAGGASGVAADGASGVVSLSGTGVARQSETDGVAPMGGAGVVASAGGADVLRDAVSDAEDSAADSGAYAEGVQLWLGVGAARLAEPIMFAPSAALGGSAYWGAFALNADFRFEHAQTMRSVAELQLDAGSLALVPAWRVQIRSADVSLGTGLRAGYATLYATPREPAFLGQSVGGFWLAPCAQLALQLRLAERWTVRIGAELAYITRTVRGVDPNGDAVLALRDLALAAQLGVGWDASRD